MKQDRFRSDLYYRLNVFPIRIPPLRERREDIPLLVNYFLKRFAKQMEKNIEAIPGAMMKGLTAWDWPGNIRELENFIERAVILTRGRSLEAPLEELHKSNTDQATHGAVEQDATASDPQSGSETGDAQLQKDVQNPVASLTLVPLQNNTNFDAGPFNRTQNVLDIQPVIPVNISSYWKVIVRVVQPLVWLPYPNRNTGGEYGLGDMAPDFFFAPRHPGKLMWGIGPAFAIPTATDHVLGTRQVQYGAVRCGVGATG